MICLQFSGACLLYAMTQRSLSQMFPCFNLCFAAGCRSSRLCVSAEGWSFRPLRTSWGMLSHSSIPPVPTTLWESCLGENNWSCLNPHWQNSSVKQSIHRLSSSHRAVVVWMLSGCCSHPPCAGRRVAWTTSQERGAVGNWNTLAAATKYLDESGSQWRWPRGQSCLETSW